MKLNVGILSLGFPNFRWDIANSYYKESVDELKKNTKLNITCPSDIIIDLKELEAEFENFKRDKIDMLFIQCGTYSHGDALMQILKEFKGTPIFMWGFPEPKLEGARDLPLNSLCGLNMYASFLKKLNVKFSYAYGEFGDLDKRKKLEDMFDALLAKKKLKNSRYCIVGGRVPGFYLSNVDEMKFRDEIGPEIIYYSVAKLLKDAKEIPDDVAAKELNLTLNEVDRVSVNSDKLLKTAKVYKALENFKEINNIDCYAIKCWPEFQELENMAVCGVVSKLNNRGILTSCEGDIAGLATMHLQKILGEETPFFADLVNINNEGILKGWHCGTASHSLGKPGTLEYCEHPTIKNDVGVAIEMELKLGKMTMSKLSEGDRYRLFLSKGEGVQVDRDLSGVQGDFKLNRGIEEVLDGIIENGIEHHFSIVYSDIESKMKEYCKWTGIEVLDYC